MKIRIILTFVFVLLSTSTIASARGNDPGDGEVPFPLTCLDFTGTWNGVFGGKITIQQKRCNWLKLVQVQSYENFSSEIIPDNIYRPVQSFGGMGAVRFRWNDPKFGKSLISKWIVNFFDRTETHTAFYELLDANTLLVSSHMLIEYKNSNLDKVQKAKAFRYRRVPMR